MSLVASTCRFCLLVASGGMISAAALGCGGSASTDFPPTLSDSGSDVQTDGTAGSGGTAGSAGAGGTGGAAGTGGTGGAAGDAAVDGPGGTGGIGPDANEAAAPCSSDNDCIGHPEGPHCNTAQGVCAACVTADHCALGMICESGTCQPGCTPQHGCPGAQTCCAGKCADTSSDMSHCGTCGNACSYPNGNIACSAGTCVVGGCLPGFEDCDKAISNGCEVIAPDAGAACACTPAEVTGCYEGPPGTQNVGICVGGTKTCAASGVAWGPCNGQVLPQLDSCLNTTDDNCDGVFNNGGPGAPGCACSPVGSMKCDAYGLYVCGGNGAWGPPQSCGSKLCSATLGCVTCLPGTGQCVGNVAHRCAPDGSSYIDEACDPLLGSACVAGACTGPCTWSALGKSNVGCEFYPTVTANSEMMTLSSWHFAAAVSNPGTTAATITVTQGATTIATVTVPAGGAQVINLPWTTLQAPTGTMLLADGAYRLRSTQPVTVFQYNPYEYGTSSSAPYTVDSSMLLPVNAWGTTYAVASRPQWIQGTYKFAGFYAVVASTDGTLVTLQPSATGASVQAGGGVPASGAATVALNRGGVLQVLGTVDTPSDLTGTMVTASRPVQVIGGHNCTDVPATTGYCDHLEESMIPLPALGKDYFVGANSLPSMAKKGVLTRIIAVEGATNIVYDPPNGAWPSMVPQTGAFGEIDATTSYRITADKRVLVAQYMKGSAATTDAIGDPSMTIAVPVGQYRTSHVFHAGTGWPSLFVDIVAPTGSPVTLDAAAVGGFAPIGSSGYAMATVLLAAGGAHRVSSSAEVMVTVYGMGGQSESFWHPGGMDLDPL
ncbi:MAG: hypothetical protein HY898_14890 [Deltaproteobacteria bacterium]|nr:hypothetical protein [Deltaproteobacteria bacterium]